MPRSIPASCWWTVLYAQAMRGVLWAMPMWPSGFEDDDAAVSVDALLQIIHRFLRGPLGQIAGGMRSAVHLASTSFMMGSPHPVVEAAALRLSA